MKRLGKVKETGKKKPAKKAKPKTAVRITEFKGKNIFGIYKTDENGEVNLEDRKSQIISFGATKAKEIMKHKGDLAAFLEAEDA